MASASTQQRRLASAGCKHGDQAQRRREEPQVRERPLPGLAVQDNEQYRSGPEEDDERSGRAPVPEHRERCGRERNRRVQPSQDAQCSPLRRLAVLRPISTWRRLSARARVVARHPDRQQLPKRAYTESRTNAAPDSAETAVLFAT